MIGASSTSASFAKLGSYLAGDESRVAWAETRNTFEGGDGGRVDHRAVAEEMRHEAAASGHVQRPVYHVIVSFDPSDRPTDDEVRQAADRTLKDLGLERHQALIVRHSDTEHPHVHLMVNRVGPDGRAWSTSHERRRLRASMEAQERELGVRWTGKNRVAARAPDADLETRASDPRGFAREVKQVALADLREAKTWAELDARLGAHGLRVERRGAGAVVTDGTREAKLSSVSRTTSRGRLEARLGPLAGRDRSTLRGEREVARGGRGVYVQLSEAGIQAAGIGAQKVNRSSAQIKARKVSPNARASGVLRTGKRGIISLGRAVGAGGERDTDVERRAVRAASNAAVRVARSTPRPAGAQLDARRVQEETSSLARRMLGARTVHRDVRPGGRIDRLAALVAARERIDQVGHDRGEVLGFQTRIEARAATAVREHTARASAAGKAFAEALGRVYADPRAAADQFARLAAKDGAPSAAARMASAPEAFGELRAAESRKAFGLVRSSSVEVARAEAPRAAQAGAAHVQAENARKGVLQRASAAGRQTSPAARAAATRVRRLEQGLSGGAGVSPRQALQAADERIARAYGRVLSIPGRGAPGAAASHGAQAKAPRRASRGVATHGTARASRAVTARLGSVGMRIVERAVKAAGRDLGRE